MRIFLVSQTSKHKKYWSAYHLRGMPASFKVCRQLFILLVGFQPRLRYLPLLGGS